MRTVNGYDGPDVLSVPGACKIIVHQAYGVALAPSFCSKIPQVSSPLADARGHVDMGYSCFACCAAAVLESINRCDVDVRRDMYNGVILTGRL